MFARDGLCAVERAAVEVGHRDGAGRLVGVHARGRVVAAGREFVRIGQLDLHRVAGELGIGADEFDASSFAHGTACAVAADQPLRAEDFAVRVNGDAVIGGVEAVDAATPPDLRARCNGARRQHRFDVFHVDREDGAGRVGLEVWPLRGVDIILKELDAREMPAGAAGLLHPVRDTCVCIRAGVGLRTLWCGDVIEQAATIESIERGHRQAAQSEGQPF